MNEYMHIRQQILQMAEGNSKQICLDDGSIFQNVWVLREEPVARRTKIFSGNRSSVKGILRDSAVADKPAGDQGCPEQQAIDARKYSSTKQYVYKSFILPQIRQTNQENSSQQGPPKLNPLVKPYSYSSQIKDKVVSLKPKPRKTNGRHHSQQKYTPGGQQTDLEQQLQLKNLKLQSQNFLLCQVLQSNKKKLQKLQNSAQHFQNNHKYMQKIKHAARRVQDWRYLTQKDQKIYRQLLEILSC